MTIKTYNPKISLKLIKVVQRGEITPGLKVAGRYGSLTEIDLAYYLGEQGGVKVVKGAREPAGGFSITFADRANPNHAETMAALVEPMDLIVIRFAHNPSEYPGGQLPIVMRGLVSDVRRDEAMGQDGKPVRRVTVSGQDYGKLWQICQIIYLNNSILGEYVLTGFEFFRKYVLDSPKPMPVDQFVGIVVTRILGPFLRKMAWWNRPSAADYSRLIPEVTAQGTVSDMAVNTWPGGRGVYHLLATVCDVANGFNELFVEDREDRVAVVLRPTPWRRPDGSYIQEGVPNIPTVTMPADDVISISATRSDAGVANIFWVQNATFNIYSDEQMRLQRQPAPITDYPNNNPVWYGLKLMESLISMGPPGWGASNGDSRERLAKNDPITAEWLKDRARILREASQDEVVFERGTLRLRGNEKIKAGNFLRVERNEMVAEYYVLRVEHDYLFGRPFVTTVHFDRGTGFIERAQRSGAPYFAEITASGI
jgi:hypothetical protein